MPSHDITSNITGTKLAAMAPDSVRKLWSEGFLKYEQTTDFFANLEGMGPTAPIQVKTDTSKGKGQKITFSVLSGFYDEPHIDEELFHTPDDFEEIAMSDFDMTVGWARHGVRNLELTEEVMGMRGEWRRGWCSSTTRPVSSSSMRQLTSPRIGLVGSVRAMRMVGVVSPS